MSYTDTQTHTHTDNSNRRILPFKNGIVENDKLDKNKAKKAKNKAVKMAKINTAFHIDINEATGDDRSNDATESSEVSRFQIWQFT